MAIPEEIRRVARPKNTVVVQSGSKGANLYAVRERAGFKYTQSEHSGCYQNTVIFESFRP